MKMNNEKSEIIYKIAIYPKPNNGEFVANIKFISETTKKEVCCG